MYVLGITNVLVSSFATYYAVFVLCWFDLSAFPSPSRTLSSCRTLSDGPACSGALLPSNGQHPPCTQWSSAPLPSGERDRLEIRRPNKLGGPNEKGLHTGETGPTDDAAQDGHVGWWLRTAVKKHVSRMDTKRLPSFLFDHHFGKTSTLLQLLLYYFQLNCTNKHVNKEPDIVYRDKCGQLSWGPDGSATMAAQGGLWWEWVIDFRLDWLW